MLSLWLVALMTPPASGTLALFSSAELSTPDHLYPPPPHLAGALKAYLLLSEESCASSVLSPWAWNLGC